MTPQTKKTGIALLILAQIALIAIWAINGYEDTWFYIMLIFITIPISGLPFFEKKNKDK